MSAEAAVEHHGALPLCHVGDMLLTSSDNHKLTLFTYSTGARDVSRSV